MQHRLAEARRAFGLLRIARSWHVDPEVFDDAPRAIRHHQHAIGEEYGFGDAVRDEQHGLTLLLPDAQQLDVEMIAGERIERAERFVHQQHRRSEHQRLPDRGALLHAAGQFMRIALLETFEPQQLEHRAHFRVEFGAIDASQLRRQANVLLDRQPRQQVVRLEHHAGFRSWPRDGLAVHQHFAAAVERDQAGDDAQQRALAAAAGSEHRDELALADGEIGTGQGVCAGIEGLRYVADRDGRRCAGRASHVQAGLKRCENTINAYAIRTRATRRGCLTIESRSTAPPRAASPRSVRRT